MASYPNRDALRDAHDIYLNAMHPFITENSLDVIEEEIDIDDIAHIITKDWFDSFKQRFEDIDPYYQARSAAWQVVESRNRASHPPWDLDPEFTRTHLFLIANLLEKINRPDAKREVEEIRDRLFSDEGEEHPTEAENAALKERLADMTKQLDTAKAERTELEKHLKATPDQSEVEKAAGTEKRAAIVNNLGIISGIKVKGKNVVEEIRDRLFSDESETHPAKIEIANLKEHLANRKDELKAEKEQHQDTQNKLAEMEGMEAEWLEMDERCKATSKELTDARAKNAGLRAENAELKERLSEAENRLKTLEERPKNSSNQPEIKEWRGKIWKQLCDYAAQKDTPVRFNKPGSENYLNVSRSLIDLTGFKMNVWLGTDNREIAIRLYMSKQNFDILKKQRKEIEQEFCESFEWEKASQRKESRISLRKDIIDPTDESDWQNQYGWIISKLEKFHKKFNEVFLPRI